MNDYDIIKISGACFEIIFLINNFIHPYILPWAKNETSLIVLIGGAQNIELNESRDFTRFFNSIKKQL